MHFEFSTLCISIGLYLSNNNYNNFIKKLDWIQLWDFSDFGNPQSKLEDQGIGNREFRKLFEQKSKSDLFHIGKGSSHMDFYWMIVSRFVICLNFLFPIYKYYERTFMNLDICTINFEIFASRFLIPYISDIQNIGIRKSGNQEITWKKTKVQYPIPDLSISIEGFENRKSQS